MNPKLLVVEDDPLTRDMLSRRLRRKGFEVLTAVDGTDAVRTALDCLPDVILMDLSMPEVDGWEAVKFVRKNRPIANTPVIALTAHEFGGLEAATRAAGFDDFEPKPIDLPRLLEKIRAHLRHRGVIAR